MLFKRNQHYGGVKLDTCFENHSRSFSACSYSFYLVMGTNHSHELLRSRLTYCSAVSLPKSFSVMARKDPINPYHGAGGTSYHDFPSVTPKLMMMQHRCDVGGLRLWGWSPLPQLDISNQVQISGAHINPAVTFANWLVHPYIFKCRTMQNMISGLILISVFRKHPWKKFPIYFVAQVLGAFIASGVVYGIVFSHDSPPIFTSSTAN